MSTSPLTPALRKSLYAFIADAAFIFLFIFIGTRNHDTNTNTAGVLSTAAPFLIGLIVGWCALRAWKAPRTVANGIGLWLFTIVIGMLLRHFAFDDGTAGAFIVVATIFNAFTLVGWRFIAEQLSERKASRG
jgi:membrane-bound ClpP family serine protease